MDITKKVYVIESVPGHGSLVIPAIGKAPGLFLERLSNMTAAFGPTTLKVDHDGTDFFNPVFYVKIFVGGQEVAIAAYNNICKYIRDNYTPDPSEPERIA